MKKINLNRENLNLKNIECGTTIIEAKLGKRKYMIDISKCLDSASIDFYHKERTDRNKYSKYLVKGAVYCVFVKPDVYLTREFFERIAEISKAQEIYTDFSNVLKR